MVEVDWGWYGDCSGFECTGSSGLGWYGDCSGLRVLWL